jgi:hypothetical protein
MHIRRLQLGFAQKALFDLHANPIERERGGVNAHQAREHREVQTDIINGIVIRLFDHSLEGLVGLLRTLKPPPEIA